MLAFPTNSYMHKEREIEWFPWWVGGKRPPNEGDAGSIPGSGISSGEKRGNPLH